MTDHLIAHTGPRPYSSHYFIYMSKKRNSYLFLKIGVKIFKVPIFKLYCSVWSRINTEYTVLYVHCLNNVTFTRNIPANTALRIL